MDWIPNPCLLRFRLAAGVLSFEKMCLFRKGMFWPPQAIFATFQACHRRFFWGGGMPFFEKVCFGQKLNFLKKILIFDNIFNIYQCAYLPYGTAAYCTVLRSHLPVSYVLCGLADQNIEPAFLIF